MTAKQDDLGCHAECSLAGASIRGAWLSWQAGPRLSATAEQQAALRESAGAAGRGEADRARAIRLTLAGWTSPRLATAPGITADSVRHRCQWFRKGGVNASRSTLAPGPSPARFDRRRSSVPSSGISASRTRVSTGATPGTDVSRQATSCHAGVPRTRASTSADHEDALAPPGDQPGRRVACGRAKAWPMGRTCTSSRFLATSTPTKTGAVGGGRSISRPRGCGHAMPGRMFGITDRSAGGEPRIFAGSGAPGGCGFPSASERPGRPSRPDETRMKPGYREGADARDHD